MQGDTISPILFSRFIRDRRGRGVEINNLVNILLLAFADHIAIVAESVEGMTRVLEGLYEYCTAKKLTVNTDKTDVMIFKKGGRNCQNLSYYLGNKEIKIVNGYSYLGIRFTKLGLFCEAAEQIESKTNIASSSTLSLINRAGIYSLGTVIKQLASQGGICLTVSL